jgi:hypothetical protein
VPFKIAALLVQSLSEFTCIVGTIKS